MVRTGFVIIFFAAATAWGDITNRTITLEEAINTALTGNRDLAALELDLNGRILAAEQARYQFAFNLRPIAGASAQSQSETYSYGLAGSRQIPSGTEIEVGARADQTEFDNSPDSLTGTAFINVRQPVFRDWGSLVNRENIETADSNITKSRRALELRKGDIIVEVVETCQELLRLERLIKFETTSIERYDLLLRLTRAREKQGRATQVDSLRVAFLKGQSEARVASAVEQQRSLQADFANLLGISPDIALMPEEMADMRLALPERSNAIELALKNRLEYAQALQDVRDSERGTRIAKKRTQPSLDVVARYERYGQSSSWSDAWALDQDNWTIGLSTDSDLLLRDERLGLRQAGINENTAKIRAESVDASICRQVDQALSACRRANAEQEIAEENLKLAVQRSGLSRRLYEKGRIDQTSATDAEIELLDAQTHMLNTRAEAVIAGYRLMRMMGLLVDVPDELKPPAQMDNLTS
jgi:outer membrane protein TolC